MVDEAGTLTEFSWNPAADVLTGIDEPLGRSLNWTHDGDHKVTEFADARSNTTQYTYGNSGELKLATYPDGSQYEYKYDSLGRLLSETNPRSQVITYTYDTAGRWSGYTFSSPTPGTRTAAYRADNLISTETDGSLGTVTYTYTAARQIDTVTFNYSSLGLTTAQSLVYTYNADGSRATMTWKHGTTTVASWTYSYDSAGRLDGVSNSFGESAAYVYDGVGKIASQTNGNGTSVEYTYNQARGWPTSIVHKNGSTPFASYDLEYDGGLNTVGNLTEVTELGGDVVTYGYDDLYRLTSEARTGTYAYTKSFEYDLAGNITEVDGSSFASYDAANKISSLAAGTIGYDASGNVTSLNAFGLPSGTFAFDHRDQMSSQSDGTNMISYLHDLAGKRVYSVLGTATANRRWYIFDGDRLIGETSIAGAKMAYTWGAAGLVSERIISSNKSLYYHFGPQGETRQLTGITGTVQDSYLYTAYGVPITSSGSDYNPHRYGGKVGYFTDGNFGVMLATHRWYSPHLMRWLTKDPIEYQGGDNLYRYVSGRPTILVDPTGLAECSPFQCCENKVSLWVCERPLKDWHRVLHYFGLPYHMYVCCDGPNSNCYSHYDNHLKKGDRVTEEGLRTGQCEEREVCPALKDLKCNNPVSPCNANTVLWNCRHWSEWNGAACPPEPNVSNPPWGDL